jgi:hypothetical protein
MMLRPKRLSVLLAASVALTGTSCGTDGEPEPGWKWSEERIFETVNQIRAGRSLQPDGWPNGGRVAVLLSFDVDNETIALRYGEPTIGALSQGEYGARVALGRVVDLLDRHEIPARRARVAREGD